MRLNSAICLGIVIISLNCNSSNNDSDDEPRTGASKKSKKPSSTDTDAESEIAMYFGDGYMFYNIPADTSSVYRTCAINEPRPLRSLNSGSSKFVHVITKQNQSTGSLFGFVNLNLSGSEKISVVDYVEYKDTICTPGQGNIGNTTIRLAAGVRLYLRIKRVGKGVNVEIPSKVAAAVENGQAEATFRIETVGFRTEETRKILSGLGESFDVESYVKVITAVRQVMETMKEEMVVNPVRIPIE
jgi:hypothetical protein